MATKPKKAVACGQRANSGAVRRKSGLLANSATVCRKSVAALENRHAVRDQSWRIAGLNSLGM